MKTNIVNSLTLVLVLIAFTATGCRNKGLSRSTDSNPGDSDSENANSDQLTTNTENENSNIGGASEGIAQTTSEISVTTTSPVSTMPEIIVSNNNPTQDSDESLSFDQQNDNSLNSETISIIAPDFYENGLEFKQGASDHQEIFIQPKNIFTSSMIEFQADIELTGEYYNKQRLPILSSTTEAEIQWEWGIIVLGQSVHQYYRVISAGGPVLDLQSNSIFNLNERHLQDNINQIISVKIQLKSASIIFFSKDKVKEVAINTSETNENSSHTTRCWDDQIACTNLKQEMEGGSTFKLGWNSTDDNFIGIIKQLAIVY